MDTLLSIAHGEVMPDPAQPRKTFVREEIERLAASIKAQGVLTPLRVMRDEERQCYVIVTGESRFRAARMAGLTHLPCMVVESRDEADLLADRIAENACRSDLRPLELARALVKLKALKGWTSTTLAKETGITGAEVTRSEALLEKLPEEVQAMVDDGRVAESTAYEISKLPDDQSKIEVARAVAAKKLNRDGVVELVRSRVAIRKSTPKASRLAMRTEGVAVNVTAGVPLTWDSLLAAIERIRKEAKKLYEGGKPVTDLAKTLKG